MRVFRTVLKVISILLLVLVLAAAFFIIPRLNAYTQAFKDAAGNPLPNSIASLEKVRLGGVDQQILIRGEDTSKPIILFLHGGPGMPMMYLAHTFQGDLEKQYIVVQWDQRGAGKSLRPYPPVDSMNVNQFVSDTHDLTDYLLQRFHKDKLYLVGWSWGSYVGMLTVSRYPDRYYAYVGMGQIADKMAEPALQDTFIEQQLTLRNRAAEIGAYKQDPAAMRENYLFEFGAEIHAAQNFVPLIMAGINSTEYSIFDYSTIMEGPKFSAKYMQYNAPEGQLMQNVTTLKLPVYFFVGKYDYTVPYALTEQYFQKIQAPRKELVIFDNSAHFMFYEEPQKFTQEIERLFQ